MSLMEPMQRSLSGASELESLTPAAREAITAEVPATGFARRSFLEVPFDTIGAEEVLALLRRRTADDHFAYVVTPNVDHVVRLAARPDLMPPYRAAWVSCCDSHPLRALAGFMKLKLPHLAGADLVARIFAEVLQPGDRVVCIAADEFLIGELSAAFPKFEFIGYSPPFGFENDPREVAACMRFIREHRGRFLFIGVGSPRSELLAYAIQRNGGATGTALCIGASLEFMVGRKRRAPRIMRAVGLEWLHRLASEPRRLWRRYAFAVAPLAMLFLRDLVARRRA